MKLTNFILVTLFTSFGIAHPYVQHLKHQREDVVWVTDHNFITETIDLTTTIWVQGGHDTQTLSNSPGLPSTSSTCSLLACEQASSSTYIAPITSATLACVAPVQSLSSPAAIYPQKYRTTAYTQPKAMSSSAPSPSSSSALSSECSSENPCEGDITYFTAGLGACGFTSDGDIQKVVALPHSLMGSESNSNPYCGKILTITCIATGKTTTATVADKCMGCNNFSIDLSNAAFLALDDLAVGRTKATWHFN